MNINGYLKRLSIIDRLNRADTTPKLNELQTLLPKIDDKQILDEGKKQGKEDFLKQIANTSGIQTCKCHIDYELPPKYDDLCW